MTIRGKLRPLGNKVLVSNMNFGEEKTQGGIILQSDDGKGSGIHPRWAQVYAVGPQQTDVSVGQWILIEHGRWSRGTKHEKENGDIVEIRLADTEAILLIADERPQDAMRVVPGTFNIDIPNS